jgi:ribosomal protein L11 methylase PrmA
MEIIMETHTAMPTVTIPTSIKLPDWTRWSWASVVERQWWQPLLQEASRAFMDIERLSVVEGVRNAAWHLVSTQDELIQATNWAHRHGLLAVPTNTIQSRPGAYSATNEPGQPSSLRIVYVRSEDYPQVLPFENNLTIGRWLGYPPCCQDAFEQTWGNGQVDSTWEQWRDAQAMSVHGPHTLFRWLGIRMTSHMPCHNACVPSLKIAQDFMAVGDKYGYKDEVQVIKEVQQWPVKWSRLFGIAEIVSPAVKISTRTDWTTEKQSFETQGYYFKPDAGLWLENGYKDPTAMRTAHTQIIGILKETLPQGARVLDLGCGNGILLRRLAMHRPDIKIAGVDINQQAIQRAKTALKGNFETGNIQWGHWTKWSPTAVLCGAGRFLEMTPEDREHTKARLKDAQVYLYDYSDWAAKGPLEEKAHIIGYSNFRMLAQTPVLSLGVSESN